MHTYTVFKWSYMMDSSVVCVDGTLATGSTLSFFFFQGRVFIGSVGLTPFSSCPWLCVSPSKPWPCFVLLTL